MITYPDSVRYLYSLGNEIRTIKLGLERIRTILAALGSPERCCRFVHVAGTNGKGSVSAMIESGLRRAGIRTGLYTSPHLEQPTERIRINGAPISEKQFAEVFQTVHSAAERLLRKKKIDGHPTYFETVTAMGLTTFRDAGVETAVLEVGLGGRLDATNVVSPDLCVITRIDYDHERYLGYSLEAIAGEKAGIMKPGVPAVTSPQRDSALARLRECARNVGVELVETAQWPADSTELSPEGSRFRLQTPEGDVELRCSLPGAHQIENAVTAYAALRLAGIDGESAREGIRTTNWPGRLEKVHSHPDIYLDGAHNPSGIRALAGFIESFYSGRDIWLLYGAMRDKSLDEIAGILAPLASRIIVTSPETQRALRADALRSLFDHPDVTVAGDTAEALRALGAAGPEDVVFVTGSLMMVGAVRSRLLQ